MRMVELNISCSELYCVRSSVEDARRKWRGICDSGSDSDKEILAEIDGILEQVNAAIADKEGLDTALVVLESMGR